MRVVRYQEGDKGEGFFARDLRRRHFPSKWRSLCFVPRVEHRRRIFKLVLCLGDDDGIVRRSAAGSAASAPRAYSEERVGLPTGDVEDTLGGDRSLDVEGRLKYVWYDVGLFRRFQFVVGDLYAFALGLP